MSIRTDLAMEMRDFINKDKIFGVESDEKEIGEGIVVTKVNITNPVGSRTIGKPEGKYITIDAENIKNAGPDFFAYLSNVVKDELTCLLPSGEDYTALIVGLGNRDITADALGSKAVDKLLITRHLSKVLPDELVKVLGKVCAITPSVLGMTGIESSLIVKSVVDEVKPRVVIVIDSLASRAIGKIGCTFQLTDTGITPGSGVGNHRNAINKESLGCDVIAIGVPMVVYASTIVHDLMESLADKGEVDENVIKAAMEMDGYDMVVTPKEIDDMISGVSSVIAKGINLSLHPKADEDLIEQLMF